MFIKSDSIYLRALEPSDLEVLYSIENDSRIWQISNTNAPYSKEVLSLYLQNAHQDIYTTKQLRLMICMLNTNQPIGTIDLFEFEPMHERVGVGILIFDEFRNKGFGTQSIQLVKEYVFKTLHLNQIYCNISVSNLTSIELFTKNNFVQIGVKKNWNKISSTQFEDEIMFQCINGE